MSTATVMSPTEFDSLLHRIDGKARDMKRHTDHLVTTVRHQTAWLGPLATGVDDVLAFIPKICQQILDWIWEFLTHPGVPWTLWNHGSDWAGPPIAGRISSLAGNATLDETRVDDAWQGPAADAYKNTLPRQKEALTRLVAQAQAIDDVLTKMALAIGAFWLAILSAIIALVIELMGETAAATTVVGAPPAAAAGAGSLVKFLGILSAALDVFYAFIVANTLPTIKDLRQDLYDNTAFPDGHWPRSTTDLSDGSLSDGDPTDWHLKAS